MLSRFFIDRPVFAAVVAILTVIAGGVAVFSLPISQYPEIAPPTVQVTASYPGANAQVVSDTVAQPIEEQVNGVDDMLYLSSTCSNDGSYTLTVTFKVGTDLDMAAVLVQNRVAIAEPMLPEEVQRLGVTTRKQSTNIVLFICLTAPDGRYDDLFLSNYATLRVKDELARIDGVGDVSVFGAGDYSMRIWLDPDRLKARRLTAGDVVAALREQNVQVAAGQVGQPPAPAGQDFQYTVSTLGRLVDVEQFEQIIVKTAPGGQITRVRDIARVELGSRAYDTSSQLDGRPCAALAIYQLPGANALDVSDRIREKMAELSEVFPEGLDYIIPFDTTLFVRASIADVVNTLFIAFVLVFVTLLVFLQDWRATLIPAVTIPVSLIGTFLVMSMLGFSINMLTLFGLVLAIGIVVDDAIVVVENAVRHLDTSSMSAREAAIQTMDEVTGPIIATTLVLLAVFVPTAFLEGVTGQLYRQFALTIATATVFSSINALTLSPALCAIVLRRTPTRRNWFYRAFNWAFGMSAGIYNSVVAGLVRRTALTMVGFVALSGLAYVGFVSLPTSFLPVEDQGYAVVSAQLPDAASRQRTLEVVEEVNAIVAATPGVAQCVAVPGFALLDGATSSNAATFWVVLEPWEQRSDPRRSAPALVGQLWQKFAAIQDANIFAFLPPAIMGLGNSGGFQMQLQDRGGVGPEMLQQMAGQMMFQANAQPGLANVYTTFRANVPQLYADVDRTKAKTLDVPLSSVFETLQACLGSAYVNDFNKFGRTYQVKVQAEPRFRVRADDIRRLEVRNAGGRMIPLGTLVDVSETLGPQFITRFNAYPAASISGAAAPGHSSGEALGAMESLVRQLPNSMGFEWAGMAFQEKEAGGQASRIFALALIFVYLVLCAQYESWMVPVAVILAIPLALLGTIAAVWMRGMDNNIYTQIGIVLLIALASKNAILIVEFAKSLREQGRGRSEAALEAARLRFRPILMTSIAFVLGVFPLVVASGAGAASRQAVGTAVFGGAIAATVFSVLFVPVFYVVVQWPRDRRRSHDSDAG